MHNAYTFDSLRALIASNDHISGADLVEALPALIAERDAMLAALREVAGWLSSDPEALESMHDDLVSRGIKPCRESADRLMLAVVRAALAKVEQS